MEEPAIDEGARRRFEAAWHTGSPEPIETHAPAADHPLHVATVEELIHIELELGWRDHLAKGSAPPPPVEDYLQRFRPLRTPGIARRLFEAELRIRARVGKPATEDDTGARFTALFPELPAPTLGPAPDPLADEPLPGMPLGKYRLRDEHARGGMGRVWRAEDPALGRTVAIKQLAPGLVQRDELRKRFVAEARIAARLDHPGVVPVYELVDGDGAPFYAMKLVRGETLTQTIARAHAPSTETSERTLARARAIEAVLAVTRTVAFAHSRGVLHRDLKPDNVVIGEFGETVLLDWGLARSIDAPVDEPEGTILGTPGYMAPEQAEGHVAQIDARSDVYALGAILHHVLAGAPPVPGPSLEASEMAPAELCSIAAIAMAPSPDDRYQDAAELAAELAQYQAGQLVSAHRYSTGEMIRRWIRRHRTAVVTGLVLLVAVAAVGAVAIRQTVVGRERAAANLDRAVAAMIDQGREQLAAGQHARAAMILAEARRLGGDTPLLGHLLADASRAPDAERGTLATGVTAVVSLGGGRTAVLSRDGTLDIRGATGAIEQRLATTATTLVGSGGRRLVAAGDLLELIDTSTAPAHRIPLGTGTFAQFSAGGKLLAVAGPTVSLRDGTTGAVLREHADAISPARVALGANGHVLAAGLPQGVLRAWSTETGEELGSWDFRPHGWRSFEALAVSDDGAVIAAAPAMGYQVAVVRVGAADIEPMDVPRGAVTELELDAEGQRLATSGRAHAGVIYNVGTGRALIRAGSYARLLPGGELGVTADTDGALVVWHARTGARLLTIDIGAGALSGLAVLGATTVAPVQPLGATRAWDLASALPAPLEPRTGARLLEFSGIDRLLAVALAPAVQIYGRGAAMLPRTAPLLDARFTASGELVTLDVQGGIVRERRIRRGGEARVAGALSGSGERALILDSKPHVIDTQSFATLAELPVTPAPYAGRLSPRGDVAVIATNNQLELWRVDAPHRIATSAQLGEHGGGVVFSPDGTRVAEAIGGGMVLVLDTATGQTVATLGPHVSKEISAIAFDATASRVVTADADGVALVWDARTGVRLASITGHGDRITAVAFDPAGIRIATASLDETARIWVAATGAPMSMFPHGGAVFALAFSPDGARLATATAEDVHVWPPRTPSDF